MVGISSSALFDLRASDEVFRQDGVEAYRQYQIDHEDEILAPGEAFNLVSKLLNLKQLLGDEKVEVVLLSRNTADTGLRIFNSISHYGLPITRAAFSGGSSPYRYATDFGTHLFLSTHADDVRLALEQNVASAVIMPRPEREKSVASSNYLRIAFDGDAVLFTDESERIYKERGLEAFTENELNSAKTPLNPGPFQGFLQALHYLQTQFSQKEIECPIRTALVTARSAPAHERVIRTLRDWGVRIDESIFLGGLEKASFLRSFEADIFFDDQQQHLEKASQFVTAGHVVHGVSNETNH